MKPPRPVVFPHIPMEGVVIGYEIIKRTPRRTTYRIMVRPDAGGEPVPFYTSVSSKRRK